MLFLSKELEHINIFLSLRAQNFQAMTFNIEQFIYAIEIVAMCVYGFTGVLALKPEKNDVINVILLGLIASTGGGTLRDVLLDRPVFFIADINYLIAPIIPIVIVFYFYPRIKRFVKLLDYLDAVGLALFVSSATSSVLADGYEPIIAILMGVMTGVGGGMMRDIVINRKPMIMGHTFYITPALIGALLYVLCYHFLGDKLAILTSFSVVFVLRVISIRYNWYLPKFMLFKHCEEDEA